MLLIFLCSITAISANDTNDTPTELDSLNEQEYNDAQHDISTDTNTQRTENNATKNIQKNNDKNTYLTKSDSDVGTRRDLEKLLNDASTGSTVYLKKDYDYNTAFYYENAITINKTLTIDGQGHTLNGANMRIFKITADNVVLRNITFINAGTVTDDEGIAIYWAGKNGILEDCTFKDAKTRNSTSTNGLVYVKGDCLTAKNCYFENNKVFRGAGFYLDSNNNEIINCTFNRNGGYTDDFDHRVYFKYSAGSGIFINGKNNLIENCAFMNQYTVYGTVYIDGENNIIKNSTFKNIYVYADGGAIYVNQANNRIIGCVIENNTAKRYGGAIYINDENNEINNCSMSHNTASEGGAIYINEKNNKVNNCSMSFNTASEGGAIYINDKNNEINNCMIFSNYATSGVIYLNGRYNHIESCIFFDNLAYISGGAIYVNAKDNEINNNIFYLNYIDNPSTRTLNDIYSTVKISADKNWWGNVNTDICEPVSKYMKNKDVKPSNNNEKVTVNNWYYIDVVDKSGNTIPKLITRIGDYVGNTFDFKIVFKLNTGTGNFNYPGIDNKFILKGSKLLILDGQTYKYNVEKEFTGDSLAFNILTNNVSSILTFKNTMFSVNVPLNFKETYPLTRLQEIIDNIWENESAYIYDNYKYDPDVDADMINGIIVNKTISIDGKGATIDLDHKTRGFYVNAPNVIIKNINIINGNLGNGGMGGAIFFNSKNGDIINATFESNTADYGGAVAVTKEGVTVTKSTFRNNYANERGAAIYVTSPGLSYTNNLFDSNHAAYGEYACVEGYKMSVYSGANNIYINNSITGIGGKDDDDTTPSYKPKQDKIKQFTIVNRKNYVKQIFHDKITVNGKEIPITNNQLTLDILNQIFNQNFTNGHLLVYIDGKLVFNDTTTDDLSQLIYNLIDLLSGKHEIKVEFTDSEGKTNTYTETITV